MSKENVEIVQRAIAAVNDRDIDSYLACCTADVRMENANVMIEGAHEGANGMRRFFADVLDTAPDFHNGGPFRRLAISERARFAIYRQSLRLQHKIGLQVFAVVIDKAQVFASRTEPPDHIAWEYLLRRLERFSTKGNEVVMLIHDEGDPKTVRTLARKSRRAGTAGSAFGTGFLQRPFTGLLDDPVSRTSAQSYFLQLADLDAFAAFRHGQPAPARRVPDTPRSSAARYPGR